MTVIATTSSYGSTRLNWIDFLNLGSTAARNSTLGRSQPCVDAPNLYVAMSPSRCVAR